ncbi:cadherin domain-containing protein [Dactylococcopsis salina]|uniref:Cadherin domain-containing protein n=1 Tax=Dactylococcopsis salina (strain PCC 8305) TaxID=13035 RepID=K9YR68_DACS8|nr:cadherin domain-containing protein [Dactylococcopsis salina]AFZ48850.1 Cadherin domain-containing protein [Dactylococcopsis salina PCC 8305]
MRQIISIPEIPSPSPGSTFSLDIEYRVDPTNADTETLTGLGMRLHFDSSALEFLSVENFFREDVPLNTVPESAESEGETTSDNDPSTDQLISTNWTDVSGNFPGEGETPVLLYTVNFRATSSFSDATTLNFSRISTPPGFELDTPVVAIDATDSGNAPPSVSNETFSIEENSPIETVVGTVRASDPEGQSLTFSLDDNSVFEIDDQGEITVVDNTVLDFETNPSFTLNVTVDDGELTDTVSVTVNVNNVNESPIVPDQTFSVRSSATNETVIGTVNASDPETDDLNLEIISGNLDADQDGEPAFVLDNTGEITVRDAKELDERDSFSLTIRASETANPDQSSIATITVNVTTSPDSPLLFGSLDDDTLDSNDSQTPFDGSNRLLFTGAGGDNINASAGGGNNRIYAGSENDVIIAAEGDRVFGGTGNDEITGNGESRFYGQAGDDLFRIGASGNNTVFGGSGNDDFMIAERDLLPDAANTIRDFTPADDTLGIDRPFLSFDNDIRLVQEETAIPTTLVILRLAGLEQEETLVRLPGVEVNEISAEDFLFDVSSLA